MRTAICVSLFELPSVASSGCCDLDLAKTLKRPDDVLWCLLDFELLDVMPKDVHGNKEHRVPTA